jgi:hypothetical protein
MNGLDGLKLDIEYSMLGMHGVINLVCLGTLAKIRFH